MKESTIQKGDRYENLVEEYIRQTYSTNERITIHHKKKYPQKNQEGAPLEIDISIEEKKYLDRDAPYDILTIIECKDHKRPIEAMIINDLSERKRKLQANEAICFASNGFQREAINSAKAAGIKLVHMSPENTCPKWITRKGKKVNYLRGLTNDCFIEPYEEKDLYNSNDVLELLNKLHPISIVKVPFREDSTIRLLALKTLGISIFKDTHIIDIDLLSGIIQLLGYTLKIDQALADKGILGRCDFAKREVLIFPSSSEPRVAFSLAHEIGHIVLHQHLFQGVVKQLEDFEESFFIMRGELTLDVARLEYQANKFAAYLLMPDLLILHKFELFREKERIAKPYLYLDNQEVNKELYHLLVKMVNESTIVSKEALKYRLQSLGLLKEPS